MSGIVWRIFMVSCGLVIFGCGAACLGLVAQSLQSALDYGFNFLEVSTMLVGVGMGIACLVGGIVVSCLKQP